MVIFFGVVEVEVDDDVEPAGRSEWLSPLVSDLGFAFESSGGAVVVVVDDVSGGAVLVVEGTAASVKVPAVTPGRGSVLAGGAEAGFDVAPAEGLAGAASTGGDDGGTAVSGEEWSGRAARAAADRERAAWRARRTSGRDIGDTPAVEKRDDTSCTPNSPRRTPVAVPRAQVTTRTRRTCRWWRPPPHQGVKTTLNRHQDGRLSARSPAGANTPALSAT